MPSPLRSVALLLASISAAPSQQPFLSLGAVVTEALRSNPEILAAQKRVEAARQRPAQERSLPDPMFSLGYQSNGAPWPGAGLGREPTSNIGLAISQQFPYPGKARLRGQIAAKEAEAEFQEYQTVRLNVIGRAKQAFYRLHHTYEATLVLERNREVLQRLLRITEARYAAGRAPQQDIFNVQTQLSILEGRRMQVLRERRAREAELNSLLGRPAGVPLPPPEEPHLNPLTITIEELFAQAREFSPMLRREEKNIQRAELSLNLARKEFLPDYTLSGGYFNMGVMPDMYMFRADVNLPLRLFRRRAAVTEKSQSVLQLHRSYEAAGLSLQSRIREDFLMAGTAYDLMQLYRNTVIPQAGLALESSLASYETGAVDFGAVLNNALMLLEYEMNYHEQMEEFHLAVTRLEEMSGAEVYHGGKP